MVKPNIEYFALKELFEKLESDFTPISSENRNEFRIHPTRLIVRSDPAMLEQMLRNLIGNALRYTENGRILVAARVRTKNVEIQVFDNGLGIPEDQLNEVFNEFHQLGNPARDRQQGLGLGLAIVKRQANLLKHEVKVLSQLNRGSCFSITLPIAQDQKAGSDIKIIDHIKPYSLEGCLVLVLDDDTAVLDGMHGLLTRWGCQVISACSPTDAFEQLDNNQNNPEMLIIDYRLPENVSGIEIAKKLQTRLTNPASVLIITGDTGPERLREADTSGYPLLHKPVQPAKLRSTMQYLLSKRNT